MPAVFNGNLIQLPIHQVDKTIIYPSQVKEVLVKQKLYLTQKTIIKKPFGKLKYLTVFTLNRCRKKTTLSLLGNTHELDIKINRL